MFGLPAEDIRFLLELLNEETVVEPTSAFPFRISKRSGIGYSADPQVGRIQAGLSIALQVEAERERGKTG